MNLPGMRSAGPWVLAAWLALVVAIIPVPHTIALRNLFLAGGFCSLLICCRRSLPGGKPWLRFSAWWLVALTTWIVFHAITIAPEPMHTLDQVRANWLVPILIAALATWAATQLPPNFATRAVIAALAAHMIFLLGWQMNLWMTSGYWPIRLTPFGAYDYHGTINSFLLALLLADRLVLAFQGESPLALGRWLGWFLMLVSLLADLGLQSRNSTLIDLVMFILAGILLFGAERRKWKVALLLLSGVAVIGYSSLRFNDRWEGFRESVVVGWSAPGEHWMSLTSVDPALWPKTPSGKKIEESAFSRSAWARKSIDFLIDQPMGTGFGHDAFGRAMAQKHGHPGLGSSHSGWLDFALGTGVIGLLMLLVVFGAAILHGWRRFGAMGDGQALLIAFFVAGYVFRCLVDGHLSGWRLCLFAVICGVLISTPRTPQSST